jgi:hypothetical protein
MLVMTSANAQVPRHQYVQQLLIVAASVAVHRNTMMALVVPVTVVLAIYWNHCEDPGLFTNQQPCPGVAVVTEGVKNTGPSLQSQVAWPAC